MVNQNSERKCCGGVRWYLNIWLEFGELFWREQGSINHNLRTIIINTQDRVQNIIQGNTWTVDDLTQELKKATLP